MPKEHQIEALHHLVQTASGQGEYAVATVALTMAQDLIKFLRLRHIDKKLTTTSTNVEDILVKLTHVLATAGETDQLLDLVQQEWRSATTRDYLLDLIPMVTPLFAINPEIGSEIAQSFVWVDEMLKR